MTEGQEVAWQQHGHKYLIEPPRSLARESIAPGWTLDPHSLFGNQNKFIVEIGTGRGENIVAAAAREPETNFLGVEVYGPGLARAILLAESAGTGVPLLHVNPEIANAVANAKVPVVSRHKAPQPMESTEQTGGLADQTVTGLANMRLVQADAPELLEALPKNSVDEFWVFFPDPWPKSKHQKRRLIDEDFIPLIARVLKPGGIIRLATDWQHYADQMQEVFAKASGIFEPLELLSIEESQSGVSKPGNQRFTGRVLTAFESKGIREGREITDLAYRRK
jgi:tRNA (guanine-N7-)-methyltransferase